jgi:hypothetical protein
MIFVCYLDFTTPPYLLRYEGSDVETYTRVVNRKVFRNVCCLLERTVWHLLGKSQ